MYNGGLEMRKLCPLVETNGVPVLSQTRSKNKR